MLPLNVRQIVESSFDQVLAMLGTPAKYQRPGQAAFDVVVGIATVKPSETGIINSYGVDAQVLTFKASEITAHGITPQKFDTLTAGTEKHVIEVCHPVRINGDVRLFRCYVRGHHA
jgi:hypothetical protein